MCHQLLLQTTVQMTVAQFWLGIAIIAGSLFSTVFLIGMSYAKKADINEVDKKLKNKVDQDEFNEHREIFKSHCAENKKDLDDKVSVNIFTIENENTKQLIKNTQNEIRTFVDLNKKTSEELNKLNIQLSQVSTDVSWIKKNIK